MTATAAKTPTPCRFCSATVNLDLMPAHLTWHVANDLHAATCQKAGQKTSVHLTSLPCNCGLE